jgi:hypothetical protein
MAGSRDVHGNMYSAFVNGRSTPATTFFSSTFTSGFVGLYDHDVFGVGQSFDNFRLSIPAPVPTPIPGVSLPGLAFLMGGILFGSALPKKGRYATAPDSSPAHGDQSQIASACVSEWGMPIGVSAVKL